MNDIFFSEMNISRPNYILVYEDLNSTLVNALSKKKLNKKMIYIVSGLRTFNQIIIDRISYMSFWIF